MNIADEIVFNKLKPFILSIRKTETMNVFAVGLLKGQVLSQHKTPIPALLVVLKGAILFRINSEEIELAAMDTYQIPVDVLHEAVGVEEENIFMITQERI
jgi:quercetin dioxygenase-like cupin family protein